MSNTAKAADFCKSAEAAAVQVMPDSVALRMSRKGFVTIRADIVVPVNVAVALEYGDDEFRLDLFIRDAVASCVECYVDDSNGSLPRGVARSLRLPRDYGGYSLDQWLLAPTCSACFSRPSELDLKAALRSVRRCLAPLSPREEKQVAELARKMQEEAQERDRKRDAEIAAALSRVVYSPMDQETVTPLSDGSPPAAAMTAAISP